MGAGKPTVYLRYHTKNLRIPQTARWPRLRNSCMQHCHEDRYRKEGSAMAGRLSGKAAIITGAAGGIGSATARLFSEEGARVVLVDRDADATRSAAADIRARVPGAEVVEAALDLAIEESAALAIEVAKNAFGQIDILVNNAGIRAYE